MKKISIIIVTYKSENDIDECLDSIWEFCDIPREQLEVIIVDNSPESEPMFSTIKKRYNNDITLIHNTHNGGYGQGNNVGIRRATAPVVMIMNPDVRLCMPLFKTVTDDFQQDKELCMYGMKQMLSKDVKSPLSFDCSRKLNGYMIPIIASVCNKLDLYFPRYMYLQGSCFFIDREKFLATGLFDEDMFMYGEENDIHLRLSQKFGPHFVYNKHLRYLHLTLERPMSLTTELKMVASIAISNEKKGINAKETYQNFIGFYRTRYYSALIKKLLGKSHIQEQIDILSAVLDELKKKTT